jgi:hypothetical protein
VSVVSLLPDNRTVLEDALGIATDPSEIILAEIDGVRGFRYARPLNVSVAPWLVLEYGLGPISDYFDTIEDLIDLGRAWQRIRGTPSALAQALGWIGYHAIYLEDRARRRRRWHLYQVGMGELPGADEAKRLTDAEYLAGLSDPARSEMFRGCHGHDVRGIEWGNGRLGNVLFGDSSGVRLDGGSVKWSHGRSHEILASDTVYEWESFGWNAAFEEFASGAWPSSVSWSEMTVPWSMMGSEVMVKSWLLLQQAAHVAFYDEDDAIIGYARVIRAPENLTTDDELIRVSYAIRTGFGDGAGRTVARVALVYNLAVHEGVKPFKAWLSAEEVIAGSGRTVGMTEFGLTFQRTVRETIMITLTIDPIQIVPVLFAKPALSLG